MLKIKYRAARRFVLFILLFVSSFLLSQEGNLAPNPSFEDVRENLPLNWVSLNKQKTSIDTATYRSGKRSIAVFRTVSLDGKPIFAGWESKPIIIEPDKEYLLEGWVKTVSATGYTYISLAYYKGDKFVREDLSETINGDNDWKQVYFVSLPPQNADRVRIRFISQGNSGTAYLDDVSLIPFPKKEYDINLAPNPSFEAGLEDRPYDWEIAKEWGENAEQFRSRQYAHNGIYSLLINVSSKGSRLAGWKSKGFPVFPGKLYTFSVWAKTQNASGETYPVIAWFNEKGWICNSYHSFYLTGNNNWTMLSVSDVPPEGATYAVLYLRSDDNPGSAWFDDARLNIKDSFISEVAVPNPSFEAASDFWQPWLSEGHCREIRVDNTFAYDGKQSLMISDVSGTVAWESRAMRLFSNGKYLYRLRCKVRAEGEEGRVFIWIAWFGDGGWIKNAQSVPAPPNTDGWVELSLLARPPEEARSLAIYLGCEDFKGTAWFDDVRMEEMLLPEGREAIEEEVPLEYAIARTYQAISVVSPDRLLESFGEAFPNKEDSGKILEGLNEYIAKNEQIVDNDLKLILGILNYHLANYQVARKIFRELHWQFPVLDMRNDIVMHYRYWTEKELEKRRKEERAKRIAERIKASKLTPASNKEILQRCADDYWELEMWKEARETYQILLQTIPLSTSESQYINYRIALSFFNEKNYKEAIDKLSAFLMKYPDSSFSKDAKFFLAKALRLAGNPRQATRYLKELWQEEISDELRWELEREAGKCYKALSDDPEMVKDYKSFFNQVALPGALYIGSDKETHGDWVGKYGDYAHIICAMDWGTKDLTEGISEHPGSAKYGKYLIEGFDLQSQDFPLNDEAAKSELLGKIVYSVYTTDPAERIRGNYNPLIYGSIKFKESDFLYNPLTHSYVNAYWDDRGETHPFDNKGPDILVDMMGIPAGVYRLSLYMREHEVRISDDEGHILAVKPRKEEQANEEVPPLYESFILIGPINVTIHLVKGRSLCTLLHGIFLDKMEAPAPLPEIEEGRRETKQENEALFNKGKELYEGMRKLWYEDTYSFYKNLDKLNEVVRILQDYIARSPSTVEAAKAHWMIWQCYLQLPGGAGKAEEAMKKYIECIENLKE
jgi:TolA-binding protein